MRFPFGALLLMFAFQLPAHAEDVIVLNSADASASLIDEATQKVVDTHPRKHQLFIELLIHTSSI